MQQLSRNEALAILELKASYTMEELKKAYREKAKYYHPDKGNDPTGEVMKSINLAYEILKSFPKQDVHSTTNTRDLDAYKYSKLVNLSKVTSKVELLQKHELWQVIFKVATNLAVLVKQYDNSIRNSSSIYQVDLFYGEFVGKANRELKQIEDSFFSLYPYIKDKGKTISYDTVSVVEFVKKLNEIKNAIYAELFAELGKLCLAKFSSYVGYEILKEQIPTVVDKYAKLIMKTNAKNERIVDMYEEIEIMFEQKFKNPRRVEEYKKLLQYIEDVDSVRIRQFVDNLKDKFDDDNFEDEIDFIMNEAKKVKEKTYLKEIKDRLIDKSAVALKNSDSIDFLKQVAAVLEFCFTILAEEKNGILTYDILYSLNDITFEDIAADKKILEYIVNRGVKLHPGYIYLQKDFDCLSDPYSVVNFGEDDYILQTVGLWKSEKKKINKVGLDRRYVSLIKCMANAEFIGKTAVSAYSNTVSVLYNYKNIYILMDEDESISITYDSVKYTNQPLNPNALKYKDRMLVLDKISSQISPSFGFKPGSKGKK